MNLLDPPDVNALAFVKGNERYIFLYEDARKAEVFRVLGRFASSKELSLSWGDAAMLANRIKEKKSC